MMRKTLLMPLAAVFLLGCAAQVPAVCRPTGWVDRVEGQWVVVEPDGEDAEELVLPLSCFPEPVHGGLRVVDGRPDPVETEAMRRRMAEIAARLTPAEK
jgi:hypothetical protein